MISAVVSDEAVRMGQRPGGEGIGGKALVHQAEGTANFRVAQLGVEAVDLRGQQQSLVYDGAAGHRRNISVVQFALDALAYDVEPSLQLVFIHAAPAGDEDLLDVRLRPARHASDSGGVNGGIAPTEHRKALIAHDGFDHAFALQAAMLFHREEGHADAILAGGRQGETELFALAGEVAVRNLNQDARAVAGAPGSQPHAPAVGQVDEDLDALDDDVVRGFLAFDVGETNPIPQASCSVRGS